MTFLFLSPWLAWLILAAAGAAAAALFVIRPRPPRRVVSSLLVWRAVLDSPQSRSWWDRVRWLVSLALTLCITAAIAVAFARPARRQGASGAGRVLLVLDSSWSMQARTPSGATRWALAMQAAEQTAGAWSAGEVALATTAAGVVQGPTSDRALVQSAFGRLLPSGGEEAAWPQVAGVQAVHFFTDGALARLVPPDVVVHSVFVPVPNVAITAFEVQDVGASAGATTVFLAVANHASTPQAVRVAIGRATDVLVDRSIEIGAGETHREALTVAAAGDPRFRAHISAALNELDVDDDASAWLWTAAPLRVAVVGVSSPLPALLAHDASLRVTAVDPAGYPQAKTDVWVFDGWLPPEPPSKPALVIDPPASAWEGKRGAEETRPIWATGAPHPILDGVDTALVQVGHARALVRPTLQSIAVSEQGTPLIAVEDSRAGRQIVLAFSVADSNLATTPAFPILMGNALDWLGRPARDLHRQPGPTVLPAATSRVVSPDGRSVPLARLDEGIVANLDTPGLYLIQTADGQSVVRVTLGDMRRSNLLVSSVTGDTVSSDGLRASGWPLWMVVTMAAFALVALEWITWQRRITV